MFKMWRAFSVRSKNVRAFSVKISKVHPKMCIDTENYLILCIPNPKLMIVPLKQIDNPRIRMLNYF